MEAAELRNRFKYHKPGSEKIAKDHETVRDLCWGLAKVVSTITGDCREKSIAITKIEEAMMWANAAIARHQDV